MAEIKNDISALDRVLGTLGYRGDLDAAMPRQKRQVLFGRGELTRAILDVLRGVTEPMPARDVAREILSLNEFDPRDRSLLTEHTRRVSKALRSLAVSGSVTATRDCRGSPLWGPFKARR